MKVFLYTFLNATMARTMLATPSNIERRISDHSIGIASFYTATRLPIEPVYVQQYASRLEAFNAERQIKGWSRKKKEAFIKEEWHELTLLAKKKSKKKSD